MCVALGYALSTADCGTSSFQLLVWMEWRTVSRQAWLKALSTGTKLPVIVMDTIGLEMPSHGIEV